MKNSAEYPVETCLFDSCGWTKMWGLGRKSEESFDVKHGRQRFQRCKYSVTPEVKSIIFINQSINNGFCN